MDVLDGEGRDPAHMVAIHPDREAMVGVVDDLQDPDPSECAYRLSELGDALRLGLLNFFFLRSVNSLAITASWTMAPARASSLSRPRIFARSVASLMDRVRGHVRRLRLRLSRRPPTRCRS